MKINAKQLKLIRTTTEPRAIHFFWRAGEVEGEAILYTLSNGQKRFDPETRHHGAYFQQKLLGLYEAEHGFTSGPSDYSKIERQLHKEEMYRKKAIALIKAKEKAKEPKKEKTIIRTYFSPSVLRD